MLRDESQSLATRYRLVQYRRPSRVACARRRHTAYIFASTIVQRRVRQGRQLALAKACGVTSRSARSRRHGGIGSRRHHARDARLRRVDGRTRSALFAELLADACATRIRNDIDSRCRSSAAQATCATCCRRRDAFDTIYLDPMFPARDKARVAAQVGAGAWRFARCGGR